MTAMFILVRSAAYPRNKAADHLFKHFTLRGVLRRGELPKEISKKTQYPRKMYLLYSDKNTRKPKLRCLYSYRKKQIPKSTHLPIQLQRALEGFMCRFAPFRSCGKHLHSRCPIHQAAPHRLRSLLHPNHHPCQFRDEIVRSTRASNAVDENQDAARTTYAGAGSGFSALVSMEHQVLVLLSLALGLDPACIPHGG